MKLVLHTMGTPAGWELEFLDAGDSMVLCIVLLGTKATTSEHVICKNIYYLA